MFAWLQVVPRSVYLACSWTWCIGMFFPVFLIGDFGIWGWVAFAIPNIVGAGAVGVVLRRPEQSQQLVAKHRPAMIGFSIVTVLFQAYFLGRLAVLSLPQMPGVPVAASVAIVALFGAVGVAILSKLRLQGWLRAAIAVYLFSLVSAYLAWRTSAGNALSIPAATGEYPLGSLMWMAPALFFGFALCPWLDLTFHRIRQETPGKQGSRAFILGFAVFFPVLVALTALYANGYLGIGWISYWIGAHMLAQLMFTVGAHVGQWKYRAPDQSKQLTLAVLLLGAGLFALGAGLNRDFFRIGYEVFMSFYGLLFPAYVWIVMVRRERPPTQPIKLWIISIALATPFFAVGYLAHQWVFLPVGVAIPLLAPIVGKRQKPAT